MSTDKLAPWYVKLALGPGLAILLVLWAMGLIPGARSPLIQFYEDHRAIADTLSAHDVSTRDALRVNRLVCRGVWRGAPEVQDQCGR